MEIMVHEMHGSKIFIKNQKFVPGGNQNAGFFREFPGQALLKFFALLDAPTGNHVVSRNAETNKKDLPIAHKNPSACGSIFQHLAGEIRLDQTNLLWLFHGFHYIHLFSVFHQQDTLPLSFLFIQEKESWLSFHP